MILLTATYQPERMEFLRPVDPSAQLPHGRKAYRPAFMNTNPPTTTKSSPPAGQPKISSTSLPVKVIPDKNDKSQQQQSNNPSHNTIEDGRGQETGVEGQGQTVGAGAGRENNVGMGRDEGGNGRKNKLNENPANEDYLKQTGGDEGNNKKASIERNNGNTYRQKYPMRKPQPVRVQQKFPNNPNLDNLQGYPQRPRQQYNSNRRYDQPYWAYNYQSPRRLLPNYYDMDYDLDYSGLSIRLK